MFRSGHSLFTTVRIQNGIKERAQYWNERERYTHNQCSPASKPNEKFKLPARYGVLTKNVWVEYSALAATVKPAVNLGQGFPDYHAPKHILQALADSALSDNPLVNQYTRGFGHPKLVQVLAELYSPLACKKIDAQNEILITIGGYEALFTAILGNVDTGDEVIIMEPFFDAYDFMVKSGGGIPRFIPLKCKSTGNTISSADWVLDEKELEGLFNSRTKMLILNTPHNPLGKTFTLQELEMIADLCKRFNVIVVSDEVYEWLVFEPKEHIRICSLPDMWERTITVGSAGKVFSVTGWKTGWAFGPPYLLANMQAVHQNCVYTCCTPIQEALARSLAFEMNRRDSPDCHLKAMARQTLPKRDMIVKALRDCGFVPTVPEEKKIDLSTEKDEYKDYKFTKKFAKETGVLGIPPTAFYSTEHKHLGENLARFCYLKKNENLEKAVKLLREWYEKHK